MNKEKLQKLSDKLLSEGKQYGPSNIYNATQIAKDTEKFYLSKMDDSFILVKFNYPLNENVPFKIIKHSSFQDTLNFILSSVTLYLSSCRKITYKYNDIENIYTSVGPKNRNMMLDIIKDRAFRNYCMGNRLIGK